MHHTKRGSGGGDRGQLGFQSARSRLLLVSAEETPILAFSTTPIHLQDLRQPLGVWDAQPQKNISRAFETPGHFSRGPFPHALATTSVLLSDP